MRIRIASLRNGVNQWSELIDSDELALNADIIKNKVNVSYHVEKSTGKIAVSISAFSTGQYICDRCGDEFNSKIGSDISVHFTEREMSFPGETPGDEIRSYQPGQEYIDISTEIRDILLLSVPMKILCSKECRGLCSKCGANLNRESCRCSQNKLQADSN